MRPHRSAGVVLASLLWLATGAVAADRQLVPGAPPVVLTDETGREVRVYEDLVKDHIVAINFIFTTCPTICQPMSAMFSRAQPLIGSRPVRLVSVTLDPATDTPRRLAEWKARFQGGAPWTLLTGSKDQIDRLRKALGVYSPDRFSHTPTVVVIDDIHGRSTRTSGLAPARTLIDAIDALSASPRKASQ